MLATRTEVEQTGLMAVWPEESHGQTALDGEAGQFLLGRVMAHMLTQVEDDGYAWGLVEMGEVEVVVEIMMIRRRCLKISSREEVFVADIVVVTLVY